jgi:hypothetical protein
MECACLQVGVLRRGKYVKGKRIGKGDLVQEVSFAVFRVKDFRAVFCCYLSVLQGHSTCMRAALVAPVDRKVVC